LSKLQKSSPAPHWSCRLQQSPHFPPQRDHSLKGRIFHPWSIAREILYKHPPNRCQGHNPPCDSSLRQRYTEAYMEHGDSPRLATFPCLGVAALVIGTKARRIAMVWSAKAILRNRKLNNWILSGVRSCFLINLDLRTSSDAVVSIWADVAAL